MLHIEPVPAFTDNYIWLFHKPGATNACVVDPGDAAPVISTLEERGLTLDTILITHHHFDHVGGVEALRDRYQPKVYGPKNEAIAGIDERLAEGDTVTVYGVTFEVIEVPGHTLDHIAFYHAGKEPLLFCGDTLFAGGCGRVFEGDAPMMHRSLSRLACLPKETRVYCAHEYTLANLSFAAAVEPANSKLQERIANAEATRSRGEPTVPSRLALEHETNPFLRCGETALHESLAAQDKLNDTDPVAVFATVRGWKDNF